MKTCKECGLKMELHWVEGGITLDVYPELYPCEWRCENKHSEYVHLTAEEANKVSQAQ